MPVRARLRANDAASVHALALAGLGVALLPSLWVAEDLAQGRLAEVLGAYATEVGGVYALTPASALLAPKVTALLAMAREAAARRLAPDEGSPQSVRAQGPSQTSRRPG